jgi:hypothetical protein
MPKQDTTPPPASAGRVEGASAPAAYDVGDVIIFKYEGNVRAEVTGHQILGGRVWVEARAADIQFLVPAHHVVGVEPKEVA